MSLEYYLFCRKSQDEIIQHLDSIINIYQNIEDNIYIEKNVSLDITRQTHSQNILFFVERKKHIELIRQIYNDKVIELCCHDFIEDTIDVTPEKSVNIRYCSICEYTKE